MEHPNFRFPLLGHTQPRVTATISNVGLRVARPRITPGDPLHTPMWTDAKHPVLTVELMKQQLPDCLGSAYDTARCTYTVQQGSVTCRPKHGGGGETWDKTWAELLGSRSFNSQAKIMFRDTPEAPPVSTEAYCSSNAVTEFHKVISRELLKKGGLANPSVTQQRSARAVLLPADMTRVGLDQIGLSRALYDGLAGCLAEVDSFAIMYRQPVINPWAVTLYKVVRIDEPGHAIFLHIANTGRKNADFDGDEANCYVPRRDELEQYQKLLLAHQYKNPLGWALNFVHSVTERFPSPEQLLQWGVEWGAGLTNWDQLRTRAYYYFPDARTALVKLQEALDMAISASTAPAYRSMETVLGPEKTSIWNSVADCRDVGTWLSSAVRDNANMCAVQIQTPVAGTMEAHIKFCMEQLRLGPEGIWIGDTWLCPAFPLPHEVVEVPTNDGSILRISADPAHLPDITCEQEIPYSDGSQWYADHEKAQVQYPHKNVWLHYYRGIPKVGRRVGCDAASLTARITQMMLDIKHNTGAASLGSGDIGKLVRCSPAPVVFTAQLPYEETFIWCTYANDTYTFSVRGTAVDLGLLRERVCKPAKLARRLTFTEGNRSISIAVAGLDDRLQYLLAERARALHGAPLRGRCRGSATFFVHRVAAPNKYCIMCHEPPQMITQPPRYAPVLYASRPSSSVPLVWEALIDECVDPAIVSPPTFVAQREGIRSCERQLRCQLLRCFSRDEKTWNSIKPHCFLMARLMCATGRLVPLTKRAQARMDLSNDVLHSCLGPRNLDHLLSCALEGEKKHGDTLPQTSETEPTGDRTRLALGYPENPTLPGEPSYASLVECKYDEVYFACEAPAAPSISDPHGSSLPLLQKVLEDYWGLTEDQKQRMFLRHHFHDFEDHAGSCTGCHREHVLKRKVTQRRSADEAAHVVVICSACGATQ